jgi:hypothetical protein
MKRFLSLVLVLVLALGSVPFVYADDMTAGEMLQQAGFVAGDENGNLMEDSALTRAQMMVLISELNGVKEEAGSYKIPATFSDVAADAWYAPYVAYASQVGGWTAGYPDGTFQPDTAVSGQMMATFAQKALGYEANWDTAVADAAALGIDVADSAELTRGEGFEAMWATVNTPKKGSDVSLGVELGRLEAPEPEVVLLEGVELDEVKAIASNLVSIEFEDDVDMDAAMYVENYTITVKGTDEELAVVEVVEAGVVDTDIVVLETEAMEEGTAYTIVVDGDTANYTGIEKVTDAPEVDSVKGVDAGVVEVVFEEAMVDTASAEDVANYSIDKEGTVVKASLQDDRYTVKLTVEGLVTGTSKKLTVEGVKSVEGVEMSKVTKTFSPDFDTKAPKLDDVQASKFNNEEVIIDFTTSMA